ncbi:Six-hairpin glycosidase [Hortaea werneckii]|nr:Six-hairpin glycosidase [Hortaea werneckii]
MVLKYDFAILSALVEATVAITANAGTANPEDSHPWRAAGPHHNTSYWSDELKNTLDVMQSEPFWNGTYWPDTIQWIGAFLNTLVAASERSFTSALETEDGVSSGAHGPFVSDEAEIAKYYSDVRAYFDTEDVIQIFDAAYDDAQWVVLEWLEAIRFTYQYDDYASSAQGKADIARFAHRAHIFYNIVQDQFDTSLCEGGITWNPTLAPYKNAITNELFLSSSIAMYLYYPGDNDTDPYPSPAYTNATNTTLPTLPPLAAHDPVLLDNAIQEYSWFQHHNFTNAQGLVVDGFHVSEGQTTCDERNEMVYTYNQGVLLSGLRQLWEATGNIQYLIDGYAFVETVINATGWYTSPSSSSGEGEEEEAGQWAGLGRNGIMEDYCDAPANCSQDNQIFKGIYFHHLDLFCEALPTRTPLVEGVTFTASPDLAAEHAGRCRGYLPWIRHNARAALATRNDAGVVGGWWGAGFVGKSQQAWPAYAVPKPEGSMDEKNEEWVLGEAPWKCQGWHCQAGRQGSRAGGLVSADLMRGRSARNRDVDDQGRERTVETQGSGVGVVKAAYDVGRID